MISLGAAVEVQVIRSVKIGQALQRIFHTVAVDNIHDDGDALAVGVVHQGLELLRGTKTRAEGKEIAHLIAEGTVIRMLLQGHDLQGIVAQFFYTRKDIPAEFLKGAHFFLLRRHANVALVDERIGALAGMLMLPDIFFLRVPHLGAEHLGDLVLNYTGGIGGKALSPAAGPFDVQFVQFPMLEEQGGKFQLPVAAANGPEGIAVRALPVVEVSDQEDFVGVGGILAEHPAAVLALVQAVEHVVVHGIFELAVTCNMSEGLPDVLVPGVYGVLVRHEPGIGLVNLLHID